MKPNATAPFTRSAAAVLAELSAPQVKKLGTRLLRKRGRGKGHHLGHSLDDVLRMRLARELLSLGVQIASIHSLFAAIEPKWPWLRSPAARTEGAALVLLTGPLGLNSTTGRAYLTTAAEAVSWLHSKQTVIVIDVNAMIAELEQRTGERYE
jgi:hypothetical protein